MPLLLVVYHCQKYDDDRQPVHVIGYDGSVSGRVRPTEERVKDTPTTISVDIRAAALPKESDSVRYYRRESGIRGWEREEIMVTHINMPNTSSIIIRTRPRPSLGSVAAHYFIPLSPQRLFEELSIRPAMSLTLCISKWPTVLENKPAPTR